MSICVFLLIFEKKTMPVKKSPLLRYKIIDELISSIRNYTTSELLDAVNDRLMDMSDEYELITLRTLQVDLQRLKEEPYNAPIIKKNGVLRYEEPGFSIFSKKITDEEKKLLCEVLSTLGQFKGIPNFEWLESLKDNFGVKSKQQRNVISFSCNNDVKNSDYIVPIYHAIINKHVLNFEYKPFEDPLEKVTLHPYLLKQYNDRWYVFGYTDKYPIGIYPLDRMVSKPSEDPYSIYNEQYLTDIDSYFDDFVGITRMNANKEEIIVWAQGIGINYIETKKLHHSQKEVGAVEERRLRKEFKSLEDGKFFKLNCIPNFELERLLCSQFGNLLLLKPQTLRNKIAEKISDMNEKYLNLRK